MTSKPVAFLLSDLGITRSHNRPYTSTDNPYSEAQFKTLKYRPAFPARFESIEHARPKRLEDDVGLREQPACIVPGRELLAGVQQLVPLRSGRPHRVATLALHPDDARPEPQQLCSGERSRQVAREVHDQRSFERTLHRRRT